MGAFADNPLVAFTGSLASEHYGEEKVHDKLGGLGKLDDGLGGTIDTFSSGAKAYEAYQKGDHLGVAKNATKSLASAGGVANTLGAPDAVGAATDVFKIASKGISAVDDFQNGKALEGLKDTAGAAGSTLKLASRFTDNPLLKTVGSEVNAFGNLAEGLDPFRQAAGHEEPAEEGAAPDPRKKMDRYGDEAVAGVGSFVDLFGDLADMYGGPYGKTGKAASEALGAGLKLGNRGDQYGAEIGAYGKDADGNNKRTSDVLADRGVQIHEIVHNYLGNSTASDVLSHVAGGGAMLADLPGRGAEAAGLGVAGYASDLWKQATTAGGVAKKVVGNKSVQELCANLYMGRF